MDISTEFMSAIINAFEANKRLADRAVEQVPDDRLHVALDGHTNSIAVIMKHVAGNLLSRWTDFLTSDGEKPGRNRDDEFVDTFKDRAEVLAYWEKGWGALFDALAALTPDDLLRTVLIRGEPHTIPLAIQRSLAHCGYHVGQIVMTARVLAGVVCCSPETTVDEARGAMRDRRIRHLPVADADGRLIGLISIGDLNAQLQAAQEQTLFLLHEYIHGRA